MNTQITATPKLFIGIDIHKRSWKVHCATDLSSGKTFSMRPDAELLYEYVAKHYTGYEVSTAYEAGCCGYRAHRCFARELKDGRLSGICVPDKCREQLRSLFRRRNDLVKDMRQIKSYIKMQLLYYGIRIPQEFDNDHWSHKFRDWLDELDFGYDTGNEVLRSRMRSFRFIDRYRSHSGQWNFERIGRPAPFR